MNLARIPHSDEAINPPLFIVNPPLSIVNTFLLAMILAVAAVPAQAVERHHKMRDPLLLKQERTLRTLSKAVKSLTTEAGAIAGGPAPVLKWAPRLLPPPERPVEIHDRLAPSAVPEKGPRVALTLDACMGGFDDKLIEYLISHKVPATIFATRRWLVRNPKAVALIKAHLDMFEIEDHGANHVPAVIGIGKTVYGIPGEPDAAHLRREVLGGALAIKAHLGVTPRWYRAATAEYDRQSVAEITRLGYKIAGFSVNADEGATLPKATIEARLKRVKDGDVIIAHMNKPHSDTAAGLSAGIDYLLAKGFVFVRVDRANMRTIPVVTRHVKHRRRRPRLPS